MEKFLKNVRVLAILLISILITMIAFFGLYVQETGVWKNVLPEYNLGMELDGVRELRFEVSTAEETKEVYVDENGNYMGDVAEEHTHEEETTTDENATEVAEEAEVSGKYKIETRTIKANENEDINIENFNKSKKIIQDRLEGIELYEYNIRQDPVTGALVVEVPNNENIDVEQSLILTVGEISVTDYQTGVILIDDSHVKHATMLASNEEDAYQCYLQIEFDEEGTEKLKQISKEYVTVTAGDGTQTTTYIAVNLDEQIIITTYFGEELTTGAIQIPLGEATTDYNEYLETASRVSRLANIISEEALPLTYTFTNDTFIQPLVTDNYIFIAKTVFAVLIVVISVCMIVKYKLEGLRQAVLSIGYIAVLSLVTRFTNVTITFNSVIALAGVIVINYVFAFKILNKLKNEQNRKQALKETMKELYLAIVPVCIIAVIFTFMSGVVISSIGMALFWGLLLQALLSLITLI